MDDIITFNRNTLAKIPSWIERSDWEKPNSLFNYGLPDYVYHLINKPISRSITEVDIICEYMKQHKYINYLEIGVSVGKTFFQVMEFAKKHVDTFSIYCIDIEKINPTLERLFDGEKTVTYLPANSPSDSIRKCDTNTITKWGPITYYEADEFDTSIWSHMPVFNLVFSDALHDPAALLHEYEQLKTHLDPGGFMYCFDDLENETDGPMWTAVRCIFDDLKKTYPNITLEHRVVNGWLGQHQEPHNFGIIKMGI